MHQSAHRPFGSVLVDDIIFEYNLNISVKLLLDIKNNTINLLVLLEWASGPGPGDLTFLILG